MNLVEIDVTYSLVEHDLISHPQVFFLVCGGNLETVSERPKQDEDTVLANVHFNSLNSNP